METTRELINNHSSDMANLLAMLFLVVQIVLNMVDRYQDKNFHALTLYSLLSIVLGLRVYYYFGRMFFDFSRTVEGSYFVAWPSPALWILIALIVRIGRLNVRKYAHIKRKLSEYLE